MKNVCKFSLVGTITLVSSLSFVQLLNPLPASAKIKQQIVETTIYNADIKQPNIIAGRSLNTVRRRPARHPGRIHTKSISTPNRNRNRPCGR